MEETVMPDAPFPARVDVLGQQIGTDERAPSPATQAADTAKEENASAEKEDSDAEDTRQPTEVSLQSADGSVSKSRLKKLKRQQMWEEGRDDRKRRRKEKRLAKQAQRRAEKEEKGERGEQGENGESGEASGQKSGSPDAPAAAPGKKPKTLVPVSLIFDCDFEQYMRETELISLSSQITRSYSANRTAARSTHIYVSSWGGKLRTRYETLLANQHLRWNHVSFIEEDFVAAARQAAVDMRQDGGEVVDVLAAQGEAGVESKKEETGDGKQENGQGDYEPGVVYLSSDSPNTLTRLEPYTSYVIGGLVDKNREKGLCYARAQARGIRTAKLPIGDYMVMASRQVLTTNHVVEIMLRWLETGDWAVAFDQVIPKRKGGRLREDKETGEEEEKGENDEKEEKGGKEEKEETGTTPNDEKTKQEETSTGTVDGTEGVDGVQVHDGASADTEPPETT